MRRAWICCARFSRHDRLQVSSPTAQTRPQTLQCRWSEGSGTERGRSGGAYRWGSDRAGPSGATDPTAQLGVGDARLEDRARVHRVRRVGRKARVLR